MAMKLKPISDYCIVEPRKEETKTKSGIVLPDTVEKDKPQEGTVVAVGPGKLSDSGKRTDMQVKAGDKVLFSKYSPTEVKVEGKEYLMASESDILAIIE